MNSIGAVVILGFGAIHLGLGVLLLATGYRALRKEVLPRLAEARPGPLDATLTILGGVGWTVVVAAFCFLVASRSLQMVF